MNIPTNQGAVKHGFAVPNEPQSDEKIQTGNHVSHFGRIHWVLACSFGFIALLLALQCALLHTSRDAVIRLVDCELGPMAKEFTLKACHLRLMRNLRADEGFMCSWWLRYEHAEQLDATLLVQVKLDGEIVYASSRSAADQLKLKY